MLRRTCVRSPEASLAVCAPPLSAEKCCWGRTGFCGQTTNLISSGRTCWRSSGRENGDVLWGSERISKAHSSLSGTDFSKYSLPFLECIMKRIVLVLFFVLTVVTKAQSSMQEQNSAPINARQDQQNYRDKNEIAQCFRNDISDRSKEFHCTRYPFPYIRAAFIQ